MITMNKVSKHYGSFQVLADCTTQVHKGEVIVVCGPSGSGKSTLIKCVNGLEPFQSGEIVVNGVSVGDPKTNLSKLRSTVGMVFQNFELFPHMSISDNLAIAQTKVLGRSHDQAREKGFKLLDRVGLRGQADKYPGQLSGGQQQRVALARSLAKSPKLLLLDEPMGALDKKLRSQMQLELVNIIETLGVTCVMVTHDQEEAMTMANRIAVMEAGRFRQIGSPDEIYEQPNSRYTAEFIGSVNLFEGKIDKDEKDFVTIACPNLPDPIYVAHGVSGFTGMDVAFALRPEKMHISKTEPSEPHNKAHGTIEDIAYFGSHSVYHIRLDRGTKVMCNFVNQQRWASEGFTWNDPVWISWGDLEGVVLTS